MRLAAGFAHVAHFVIEGLPVLGQDVAARDDDVDFRSTGADAFADFGDAEFVGREACGEAGGDGGDGDGRAFQGADGARRPLEI